MEASETRVINLNSKDWAFVKSCIIGDGSLTKINRGNTTVMLSINHCINQKPWLESKAERLNAIFGRSCAVGERETFDERTQKTYYACSFSVTSQLLSPLYELAYPGGKKHFSQELLGDMTAEHLAVLWADDGNLEPKARVGRLNLYDPEEQCNVVADWIESLCSAIGRYEDYEGNGHGRLRYPATEMVKIVLAIKPYLHPSMFYKIDMQYKNNTKNLLTVSSPNCEYTLDTLPETLELSWNEWSAIAKKIGVSATNNGTKESLRERIIKVLEFYSGQ